MPENPVKYKNKQNTRSAVYIVSLDGTETVVAPAVSETREKQRTVKYTGIRNQVRRVTVLRDAPHDPSLSPPDTRADMSTDK